MNSLFARSHVFLSRYHKNYGNNRRKIIVGLFLDIRVEYYEKFVCDYSLH